MHKKFVTRLKRLRSDRGMAQEVLAERASLSRVYVTRLETGRQDPTLTTLLKLAKALKVKPEELLK